MNFSNAPEIVTVGPQLRIRTEAGEEELDLDEFEARVARGEVAPHCQVMFPAVAGHRWVPAGDLEFFKALYHPRRLYFARAFNLGRFPRATAIFVLLNVAIYVAMSAHGEIDTDTLVTFGAKVAPLIVDVGEFWRLITANAVHVDVLHISFNLLVFFNVGGALENAFRTADYVLLLIATALGTTLTSLVFSSNAITAGSSGIVYGMLGASVVFGIKYREILPRRYRRLLGEWAILPVLIFLYLGWIQKSGVDNWGHFGGLATGVAVSLLLRPRLLAAPHTRLGASLRVAPAVALVLFVVIAGFVARPHLPPMRTDVDDNAGLEMHVPSDWRSLAERVGESGAYNGLNGHGRASVSIRARITGDVDLGHVADAYARSELMSDEHAGRISDLQLLPAVPAHLGGHEAELLEATYVEENDGVRFKAYFLPRGRILYEIVFIRSEDFGAYEPVLQQIASSFSFAEPRALREARAQVLLAPSSVEALTLLGDLLVQFGDGHGAVLAFERAASESGEARILSRLDRARRMEREKHDVAIP
jgi:rhomboid protease GluP